MRGQINEFLEKEYKYNIGDDVYYFIDNKIKRVRVDAVNISSDSSTVYYVKQYIDDNKLSDLSMIINEVDLHRTEEEALASLKWI